MRRRTPEAPAAGSALDSRGPESGDEEGPRGKGHPTPKRSQAQRQRRQPLGRPPTSRREAHRQNRAEAKGRRAEARAATKSGSDRYLPARDQGPVRRFIRDLVDSRRSILTFFLVAAVLLFAGSVVPVPTVQAFTVSIWFATLVAMVVDGLMLGFLIRRRVRERFPDGTEAMWGLIVYGLIRATQLRRLRMPKARVRPGTPV